LHDRACIRQELTADRFERSDQNHFDILVFDEMLHGLMEVAVAGRQKQLAPLALPEGAHQVKR
jgi:hypothetical protein